MKPLFAVCGVVLCAVVMAACVDDEPPVTGDDPAELAAAPDGSEAIIIPRELSFEQIDGTFKGNGFTAITNACHVTLLFCRDPRISPSIPSFCQNGGCSQAQALSAAFSLCDQICGVSACNVIAQFPNSPGC